MFSAFLPNRLAYRANSKETQEIESQVKDLLDIGWVRESLSPSTIPIMLVPKKMVNEECAWIVEP